ncbi:nucleotidyltransferase domain-containing protein [Candidatus Bipolaricaulota bacterium]|nr:nucleotidyltransferase domain-containing protein [Candidatus Bipolaricaulota bacterium]HBR10062.1 nucleotidyltransferase domain-containing protein [Candidatus Acetothermia bacterium]
METHQAEGVKLRLVKKAKADQDLLAVILFGSHVRGEEGPASDLDICLVLQPGDWGDLELSQKKLEYLKSFNLDAQVYQQLPLYIRRRVLKEGKVLFCRDVEKLYELAFRTVQEFEDFKHIYHGYLEEVARG